MTAAADDAAAGHGPRGYYTDPNGTVHPIMGPENKRPRDSTEPTLWSAQRATTKRAPRSPFSAPARRNRAELRSHAAGVADDAHSTLGAADARMIDAPHPKGLKRAGEWDWFHELHPDEKARLRRSWIRPHGQGTSYGPDQVADSLARYHGRSVSSGADIDREMKAWLDMTRRADAARALSRGRVPKPSAYGNPDLNALLGDTGHDANAVFADTETQRAYAATRREHEDWEASERRRKDREYADRARRAPAPAWADEEF